MGHMTPCSNIAEALKDAGHEVTIISIDSEKTRHHCPKLFDPMGVKYILTEGPEASVLEQPPKGIEDPKELYIQMWEPHCIAAVKELNPDMVVCDFFSRNGILAADQMGIPSVVQIAIPLGLFTQFKLFRLIDMDDTKRCCGCLCVFQGMIECCLQCAYKT